MLTAIQRRDARVFHLPGRDFLLYIGPDATGARNAALGVAVFPEGSAPPGHVHESEEEIIYIIKGHGELVTPEGTAQLEPGVAVFIPVGVHHATVSLGPGALEMVSVFSPPVIPGSYERPPQPAAVTA